MKESTKKVLKIIAISCSILIIISIFIFSILKYIEYRKVQENIETIYEIYKDDNKNEIITDYNNTVGTPIESETDEGQYLNAIGILEIPSINFKDIVVYGQHKKVWHKVLDYLKTVVFWKEMCVWQVIIHIGFLLI